MNPFARNRGLLDALGRGLSKSLRGTPVSIEGRTVALPYGLTMHVEVKFYRNSLGNKGVILFIEREPNIIWGCVNLQEVGGGYHVDDISDYGVMQWYRDILRPGSKYYSDIISKIQQESNMSNLVQIMRSHYQNEDFRYWSKDPDAWELQEFQKTKVCKDTLAEFQRVLTKLQQTSPKFKLKDGYFTGFKCEVLLPIVQLDFKKGEIRSYDSVWCYKGGNFKGKGEVTIGYIDSFRNNPESFNRIHAKVPLSFITFVPEPGIDMI